MFINNFDPVAFQIFSLEIRWYSLAYIIGIALGWLYCKKRLIKDSDILQLFDDFITYLIIEELYYKIVSCNFPLIRIYDRDDGVIIINKFEAEYK